MDKKSINNTRSARKTEQTPYTYSFWSIFTDTFATVLKILIIVVLLVGVIVGCLGMGMVIGWIQTAEPITAEQLEINTNLTTFIYDNQENVIAKLTGSDNINREQIGYDKIPLVLEHAIVSIEDERFYEHKGFDLIRIAGSVYSLIVNKGEIYQGGSTLTQQVYKNYTYRFEQTFERKFQELYNSILIEMRWDKKTILTAYTNIVNMGNGCYGFQSASKLYFGKDLTEITLGEAAFLAGMPNAPTLYNPYTEKGYENTITRMKNILDKMLELGYISEETHSEARDIRVEIKPMEETIQATATTTYFIDQAISDVIDMLVKEKNISRSIAELWVYNNGYHIYTTMDPQIQEAMDEVFLDPSYFPTRDSVGDTLNLNAQKYGELPQAAMVIMDQTTGKVLAMYGGGGEKTGSQTLNRATQTFRQPGSSFKPIAIYGPALELELITAATVFDDVPVYLDPKNPDEIYPTNYISGDYIGLVTIRYAIKSSINVIAARVWTELLGRDNSVAFLDRVGIQRGDVIYDDSTVSTATGGLEKGVNPYLMTNAFATFANKGVYIQAYTFTEVKNHRDEVVLKVQPKYDTVYRSQTAFIMTDILQEVTKTWGPHYHHTGTAYPIVSIQDGAIPVAGKTGTTSDYLDKWFCGYTPYYTGAVWYGYDNRIAPIKLAKGKYRNVDGKYIWDGEYNQAMKIWDAVMDKVHEGLAPAQFEKPTSGIVEREICMYSGKAPTDLCHSDPRYPNNTDATLVEYFLEGTEPNYFDTCEVHQTVTVCTSSTDPYGRFLLATDYCPSDSVRTIVGIARPTTYVPYYPNPEEKLDKDEIGLYPIIPEDMAWDIVVGNYCTAHVNPLDEIPSIIVEIDPETGEPLVPTPPPSEQPLIP